VAGLTCIFLIPLYFPNCCSIRKKPPLSRHFSLPESLRVFISDLAFHSTGIILYQKKAAYLFSAFVRDLFGEGGITILSLTSEEIVRVEQVAAAFGLDFDDAYQYVVAEKFDLMLVSFDTDFDRTDKKRIMPAGIQ
jgi:predicted nucleic acid-binding protein